MSGVLTLTGRSGTLIKVTCGIELFAGLLGGLPGMIVGGVNLFLISDPEVKAYLESTDLQ